MTQAKNVGEGAAPDIPVAEQQHDDMLNAGLDELDQGFTVFDAELRMVAWNRSFLRLLDFPESMAHVGAPFANFIRYNALRGEYGPGDPEALIEEIVGLAGNFASHYSERHRPNGRIIAVRGAPLPHFGFITLYTDVTEQRRYQALIEEQNSKLENRVRERTAELESANLRLTKVNAANLEIAASLRRSEERLRLITDRVPANIGYFDNQLIFRYANQGYSNWFSRPIDEIVGHSTESVLGTAVWLTVRDNVLLGLSGKQVSYEYSLTRPDGRPVFARSTLVPEFAPDGTVLGCFVLALDITEQKRTQAALAQAQKMEAIGQLTGGIAHDFNNMLTVVIGNLAVLREQCGRNSGLDEHLDAALQASRRGVDLVKRLLAFSRQQPLAPKTVDIAQLVQEMAKLIRRSLPESIALTTRSSQKNLLARIDPNQLDNALLNLVLNARDAMPHSGQIRIEISSTSVSADSAPNQDLQPGDYISITVSDDGLGMDSATLARVFEPFFTTKAFGKGSGLGMSMVYGFVKQSGGTARISSVPGRGTTVTLLVPGVEEATEIIDAAEVLIERNDNSERLILLVEDDAEVRRIVRRQLTSLGYPVLEAENGPEAVNIIENVPGITTILSDIVMPGGIDGWELARFVKKNRPKMRIVLMSGYAYGHSEEDIEDPELPMLSKPFDKSQLANVLQSPDE
ncbi:MAG: PAS-domain containing protein [Rhodocyclaceae bacterium]